MAMERTGEYRGRYHVLMGALSPLDGIGPDELKVRELLVRLEGNHVREVILATNPNVEGDATALYLSKLLRPLGLRITRIARGLPVGGRSRVRGRGDPVARARGAARDVRPPGRPAATSR